MPNYPNITLYISPESDVEVRLYSAEDDFRVVIAGTESLHQLIAKVREASGINATRELWELANEGDLLTFEPPVLDFDVEELDYNFLYKFTDELQDLREQHDVSAEVQAELDHNWLADVLAMVINSAYDLAIGKALLIADEMGIETVRLYDERLEPRLREKMALDLGDIGKELLVVG